MIYILNQLKNTSYPVPDDAIIYYRKWPTEDCPFSVSFDATPDIRGAAKREYHLGYYWNEDKVKAILTLINGRRGQPGAYYVMPEEEEAEENENG